MYKKSSEALRRQQKRFHNLQKLKNHDNNAIMLCLSSASEKPILTRIVSINFREQDHTKKSTKEYSLHLSTLASSNIEKYLKTLEEMNFPYRVEFGDFYLIKRASEEEVQTFLDDRAEKLEEFLSELKR